jgi:hypothetical protein
MADDDRTYWKANGCCIDIRDVIGDRTPTSTCWRGRFTMPAQADGNRSMAAFDEVVGEAAFPAPRCVHTTVDEE